ncbi:MAG: DUF5067 domain-containing protein [Clostridia bacterium]|nr:DUF5067 domain-containing protein [Clostridia bacterium]
MVKNRIEGWEIEDISCKITGDEYKYVYVEFTCTNRNSSAEAFAYDVMVAVYQDGVELNDNGGTDYDALNNVKSGISVTYEYGRYRLTSETSDIEVEFSDILGNTTYSRTFEIEDCRVEED